MVRTGHLGRPQPWLNLTGRVLHAPPGTILTAAVGHQPPRALNLGPDGHRLAAPGDFNLDLDLETLPNGITPVHFEAHTPDATVVTADTVIDNRSPPAIWPLPWSEDFTRGSRPIGDRVQVVDGPWHPGPYGLTMPEPYYDRVLAFGDPSWRDYEVEAVLRVDGQRMPVRGVDAGHDVVHVALTLRWPGHHADSAQPHRRWYPLGATCEFRLLDGPSRCRWRMLDPNEVSADPATDRRLNWDQAFHLKARVSSLQGGGSHYQCKAWPADTREPQNWDLEHRKCEETVGSGGALFVAHYTAVTLLSLSARPL